MTKIKFLNLFLVLALFPAASLIIKDLIVYSYTAPEETPVKATPPEVTGERNIMDYSGIVKNPAFPSPSRTFFPITSKEIAPETPPGSPHPAGLSEMTLLGTFIGPESYAIFELKGTGKQEAFKKGNAVFERGVLKEVLKEKAVISTITGDVVLTMPEKELTSTETIGLVQENKEKPRLTRKLGEKEWVLDQKALLESLEDMTGVLTDARLTPRVVDGVVEGFVVTEIKPRGIFDAVGLKNGDILVRVNNFEITSPEKAVQVLSGLKGSTTVDLDLIRGGNRMSFHYQIR